MTQSQTELNEWLLLSSSVLITVFLCLGVERPKVLTSPSPPRRMSISLVRHMKRKPIISKGRNIIVVWTSIFVWWKIISVCHDNELCNVIMIIGQSFFTASQVYFICARTQSFDGVVFRLTRDLSLNHSNFRNSRNEVYLQNCNGFQVESFFPVTMHLFFTKNCKSNVSHFRIYISILSL